MIELEKNIGYVFKNRELLKEALTHSSFVNGDHSRCNERLEFLGDSVLSVTVSQHLFVKRFARGDLQSWVLLWSVKIPYMTLLN